MGLGPPMCLRCRVWARYTKDDGWYCEFCNSNTQDVIGYFYDNDIPSNDELEGNRNFYKFFKDGKNTNGIN